MLNLIVLLSSPIIMSSLFLPRMNMRKSPTIVSEDNVQDFICNIGVILRFMLKWRRTMNCVFSGPGTYRWRWIWNLWSRWWWVLNWINLRLVLSLYYERQCFVILFILLLMCILICVLHIKIHINLYLHSLSSINIFLVCVSQFTLHHSTLQYGETRWK